MENVNVTGPVSFDDVLQALGDSDPGSTNASKLRAIIGRGSFGTIQKHLDAIRAKRAQALNPEAVETPPAPPELLSMWGAAVAVAVAQVRGRLDSVVQERDTLSSALTSARGDVEALAGELEAAATQADQAGAQLRQQLAEAQALAAQHAQALQEQGRAVEALKAQHAEALAQLGAQVLQAQQQVQVSELQAQLGAQALQTTIDRLTDQVGELKSLLSLQARQPAAQLAAAAPKAAPKAPQAAPAPAAAAEPEAAPAPGAGQPGLL